MTHPVAPPPIRSSATRFAVPLWRRAHLARREPHRNHCAVIIAPPERSDGERVVMTHRPPTRQRDSNPVPSQEDRLLDLLRKAEGYAYALAHGYDIGGTAWQGPSMAPLVPKLAGEQAEHVSLRKVSAFARWAVSSSAERLRLSRLNAVALA